MLSSAFNQAVFDMAVKLVADYRQQTPGKGTRLLVRPPEFAQNLAAAWVRQKIGQLQT